MDELIGLGSKLVRGAPKVRVTSPVLARYLDDLRFAEQARDLDRFYGRIPAEPGPFDNINLPEMPDPVAAERAVGAAPRTWLENAEMARGMEPQPAPPLTDMLLDNDRRRALLASRLDRLTPEQRARSLPSVGQQYDADRAAARAAQIKRDADAQTAAALIAAGTAGAGAFAARTAQLANEQDDYQAGIDADIAASLSGNPDGAMPMAMDVGEDSLVSWPEGRLSRMAAGVAPDIGAASVGNSVAELAANAPQPDELMAESLARLPGLLEEEPVVNLERDSPDEAVASAPGPSTPVGRNMDMEDLPGPQMRSVQALMRAGIPAGRAMDIITGGASMSPAEYRMVTGGRR